MGRREGGTEIDSSVLSLLTLGKVIPILSSLPFLLE